MLDYLIVGSGLTGSVFAHEAKKKGKDILVIDKRTHIGGNCYTERINGIMVHKYGPHIFHTSNEEIWEYVNQFVKFNNFRNQPKAIYKDKMYSLPFNMNTFYELWGLKTPTEVVKKLNHPDHKVSSSPNLENHVIANVGKEIYETLIKGYTEKQWGKSCDKLSPDIIKRLPIRLTFNNDYFDDLAQGIPIEGYTVLFERLLKGVDVELGTWYNKSMEAKTIIYTGPIDEYFNFCYGPLEWRSLRFETETLDTNNFQGTAVINYTDKDVPYTRIVEHKFFESENRPVDLDDRKTIITREYPVTPNIGDDVYYPVDSEQNHDILNKYEDLAANLYPDVIFAGRCGRFEYMNMDIAIGNSLNLARKLL
jgi:UDP-galactopyranose mutase